MRWFHELLFPFAILMMVVSLWVSAESKAMQRRAAQGCPPENPAFARMVLQTYGYHGSADAPYMDRVNSPVSQAD